MKAFNSMIRTFQFFDGKTPRYVVFLQAQVDLKCLHPKCILCTLSHADHSFFKAF